jgi:hypothetical protein
MSLHIIVWMKITPKGFDGNSIYFLVITHKNFSIPLNVSNDNKFMIRENDQL